MSGVLVDTNVLSELMRPEPAREVMTWFAEHSGSQFYVSAITQAEILLGIALLPQGKRQESLARAAKEMFDQEFSGKCLPFAANCATIYAEVVAVRQKSGLPFTTEDAQIASIALVNGYALATRNVRDFEKISDLRILNPWNS